MMRTIGAVLCGLALMAASVQPVSAAENWAQKAINKPADMWGIWGHAKGKVVADPSVEGGMVERVTISPKPKNPWDIGGYVLITKPVKKGDVILFAFWARAAKLPAHNDFIGITGRVYQSAPPSKSVTPETQFLIGPKWKLYTSSGTADQDYPVGTLGCGMILGTGEQTIDFGPVYIVDFGPGYDLSKLPKN